MSFYDPSVFNQKIQPKWKEFLAKLKITSIPATIQYVVSKFKSMPIFNKKTAIAEESSGVQEDRVIEQVQEAVEAEVPDASYGIALTPASINNVKDFQRQQRASITPTVQPLFVAAVKKSESVVVSNFMRPVPVAPGTPSRLPLPQNPNLQSITDGKSQIPELPLSLPLSTKQHSLPDPTSRSEAVLQSIVQVPGEEEQFTTYTNEIDLSLIYDENTHETTNTPRILYTDEEIIQPEGGLNVVYQSGRVIQAGEDISKLAAPSFNLKEDKKTHQGVGEKRMTVKAKFIEALQLEEKLNGTPNMIKDQDLVNYAAREVLSIQLKMYKIMRDKKLKLKPELANLLKNSLESIMNGCSETSEYPITQIKVADYNRFLKVFNSLFTSYESKTQTKLSSIALPNENKGFYLNCCKLLNIIS